MSGANATISGNVAAGNATAEQNIGGGVFLSSTAGTFTMSGANASITNNKASYAGGGVYVSGGAFTMVNGTVYGTDGGALANTANASGRSIRLYSGTAVWPENTTGYVGIDSEDQLTGNIGTRDLTVRAAETPATE
jgi:hypothetical protein